MRSYHALALNFLEVFSLARHDLEAVATMFPEESKAIRRKACSLACRRAFIQEAQLRKAASVLQRDRAPALPSAGEAQGQPVRPQDAAVPEAPWPGIADTVVAVGGRVVDQPAACRPRPCDLFVGQVHPMHEQ